MGKPNKAKRNPFFWFMMEVQKQEREKGNLISMSDLPGVCSPSWDAMSKDEKNYYEQQALKFRHAGSVSNGDANRIFPTTSSGVNSGRVIEVSELLMAMDIRDENYQDFVNNLVERLIGNPTVLPSSKVQDMPIFIASFNVMCVTQSKDCIPNELGLVEYTINDGIRNSFHQFIHCGGVPIGYYRTALEHSEETHKLPLDGMPDAAKSPEALALLLQKFVDTVAKAKVQIDGVTLFPVYTMPNHMEQLRGCLSYLAKHVNNDELAAVVDKQIIVLDVVRLLLWLNQRKTNDLSKRPYPVCENDLTMTSYDFTMSALCEYHCDREIVACALGHAKRTCYLLSDVLCKVYEVEATEAHLPKQEPASYTEITVSSFGSDERSDGGPGRVLNGASGQSDRRDRNVGCGRARYQRN